MAIKEGELFTSGTLGGGHQSYTCLFNNEQSYNRSETLILKSDMLSAGFVTGDTIIKLKYKIGSTPSPPSELTGVKIGMKHVTKNSNQNGTFETWDSHIQVDYTPSIPPDSYYNNLIYEFPLDTPFVWNGVDNIVVTLERYRTELKYGGTWSIRTMTDSVYRYKGYKGSQPPTDNLPNGLTNYQVPLMILVADEATVVASSPNVLSASVSKQKISDEVGMNQSIITVQFDQDVTQYVARLNGVDHTTGTLVHQGDAVLANTDVQIIVDWSELESEGQNKINIYGQNVHGWTTYT